MQEDMLPTESEQLSAGGLRERLIEVTNSLRSVRAMEATLSEERTRIIDHLRQLMIDEDTASITVYVNEECTDDAGNSWTNRVPYKLTLATDAYPSVREPAVFDAFIEKHGLQHLYGVQAKRLQGFVNHELERIDPAAFNDPTTIGLDAFKKNTIRVTKG